MIQIDNISVQFNDEYILQDFSLELPESGSVCLFAPSGSGKTTLLRVLCGLTQPEKGSVKGLERKKAAVDQAQAEDWNSSGSRAAELGETGGMVFGTDSGAVSGEEQEPGALRGAAAEGTVMERSVVELVRPAAREPSDPRTLSQVFQRDARRYDGGFTLY